MHISFQKLQENHFPLLYRWLMTPHVRAWWDRDVTWTPELIAEKYNLYIQGYKQLRLNTGTIRKPIYPYIIMLEGEPIGYIQYYNKHDFPPEQGYNTSTLPHNLAAIDWYIGEVSCLNKGIGSHALEQFMREYIAGNFDHVFVDPDSANKNALKIYQKAGFTILNEVENTVLMLKRLEIQHQP